MSGSLLLEACIEGRLEDVAALIAQGCDVNQQVGAGNFAFGRATPLHWACDGGHTDVAAALIAAGAAVDSASEVGRMPLHCACHRGNAEIVSRLLAAGAAVDPGDVDDETPLHLACVNGYSNSASLLLAAGAAVDPADKRGATPLLHACDLGRSETASLLLAAGAAVDHVTEFGATPLSYAIYSGHLHLVQLLSSYGTNRVLPTSEEDGLPEETAEEYATDNGKDEIAAWLASTRQWTTAIHHLPLLGDAARVRLLLRDGRAALAAADDDAWHSDLLRRILSMPDELRASAATAPLSPAADLVLRAIEPWSPHNPELFPTAARSRAVTVLLLGHRLSREARFAGEEVAMFDLWRTCVMRFALTREDEDVE
jgi:ankyrin repeat protein